ncbi:MAG: hypothetical protein P4L84_26505 [Isosphaeraceae bacterium]|nr:hypothetical protein [Isosphaeraceae bacterium]
MTIRIHTRSGRRDQPGTSVTLVTFADRLADELLRGWLAAALSVMFLVQFAGWLPHYLTWPWWPDCDVFASLALGWHRGVLPYRDLTCNNFPGTVYVYWVVGRLFGWGWNPAINTFDAGLLVGLGVVVLAWSHRRLGGFLPGVVGFASFASYYFGLDYSLVAQRDWQGPCIAVAALLILDGWPGHATRWLSAFGLAFAFAIRPQVVLLGPAFLLAIDDGRRRCEEERGETANLLRTLPAMFEWGGAVVVGLVLAFVPLALAGLMGDFLTSLHHLAYGGSYNRNGPVSIAKRLLQEFMPLSSFCIPALVLLLASRGERRTRRIVATVLTAYLFVALYKPLSPIPAPYLDTPLRLIWSLNLALIVAMVMSLEPLVPALRLATVLAILPLGITTQPRFCEASRALQAVRDLRSQGEPEQTPAGYTHSYLRSPYPWSDYRKVLAYLRSHTGQATRVANALKHDPAITGPAGRVPAFSAESLAWLRLVNPADEPRFVESLERATDSVVVWSPREAGNGEKPLVPSLFAAIERLYEPEARFGVIEVWRRKLGPAAAIRPDLTSQVE